MATTDQECPVAKKSLLPYLTGKLEGTPDGDSFEEHVKECVTCRELVGDRRKALQTLIAAINEEEESKPLPKVSLLPFSAKQWKPLAISSVIAVVLIGVSYFIRPDNNLFGEKVVVETMPPVVTEKPKQLESQIVPPPAEEKPLVADATEVKKPVVEKPIPETTPVAVQPKPEPPKVDPTPKPKPKFRIAPKPKSKPKPEANRIEVFDEYGKRIGVSVKQ